MTDEATRAGKRGAKPAEPVPPVRKVGRFVVDGVLGEGGMGVVLAAHDPDLDRKVAIKLLHDDEGEGSSGRGRLLREAQAMARLRHPNVVTVHEVGRHEGDVYVAMEYVPGGTLRAWLEAHPQATCDEILARFVPAGRGLAAAHAAGLVHRDFKPDNVMVDEHGRVLVTDFGIAGLGDDAGGVARGPGPRTPLAQTLTSTGDVMGTPRYMSPEQHLAQPTDARSDQFAFCAALYEALFGVKTFAGEIYEAIRQNAIDGVLTPPAQDRDVPDRVRDAVVRGLTPGPDLRWPSMEALLDELAPPAPAPPPRKTWPLVAVGAGVAIAAGIVILAWPRARPAADPLAKQHAAQRAAQACDCELVTVELPAGATLVATPEENGQLAVPRGDRRIEYTVDGQTYAYALRSEGAGATRTLALPAPERRDGFVFVPGGDVAIGEPLEVVHLDPYLIAITEEPVPMLFDDARQAARAAHARLPTAAEWEWAARLGVVERALTDRWEWTSTIYSAGEDTIDVRGGQDDAAAPRPSRRLAVYRSSLAELRLARSPSSAPPPGELSLRAQVRSSGRGLGVSLPDTSGLDEFVDAWAAIEPAPALQLERAGTAWCFVLGRLEDAGVDLRRVEVVDGAPDAARVIVRFHPDPAFQAERPAGCIPEE